MRAASQERDAVQVTALADLRFALATCFAALGRSEKAKKALSAVLALKEDAETLAALASLAARDSEEEAHYLDRAMSLGSFSIHVFFLFFLSEKNILMHIR